MGENSSVMNGEIDGAWATDSTLGKLEESLGKKSSKNDAQGKIRTGAEPDVMGEGSTRQG